MDQQEHQLPQEPRLEHELLLRFTTTPEAASKLFRMIELLLQTHKQSFSGELRRPLFASKLVRAPATFSEESAS